jgi:Flp pilus assembly pilin Flp
MQKGMFRRHDRGASLLEYALLVALISIVGISVLSSLGQEITQPLDKSERTLKTAAGSVDGGCDATNPNYPNC